MSQGERPGPEASIMKLSYAAFVKELSATSPSRCRARTGSCSTIPTRRADGVFQQKFLNAVQSSIGGGTDEIQRNIVGERVLGLPREPR